LRALGSCFRGWASRVPKPVAGALRNAAPWLLWLHKVIYS
jgi:hypothetical protein